MKTLLALLAISSLAFAGDCHVVQRQVVAVEANQVIVPLAVPVAVPVASVVAPGVFYSANVQGQAYSPQVAAAAPQAASIDADELAQFRAWKASQGKVSALATPTKLPSAVYAACAKCHAGATPKAGFSVLGDLTIEDRIRAAREVVAGNMPKGKQLDPAEAGKVLAELLGDKPKVGAK